MKVKNLVIILFLVLALLIYSMLCYKLLNTKIENDTKNLISNYFANCYPQIESYEYLKAVSDGKETFKVFVKADKEYYTFYFSIEEQTYVLLKVENLVPAYI